LLKYFFDKIRITHGPKETITIIKARKIYQCNLHTIYSDFGYIRNLCLWLSWICTYVSSAYLISLF